MDFEGAVEEVFGEYTEIINDAVVSSPEKQKSTHVNVSVDQLIRLWNLAVEGGFDNGFEKGFDKGYSKGFFEGING